MLIAVALGAFGAHALRSVLSPEMLEVWRTGVTYQMVHGLGLLALSALLPHQPSPLLPRAGVCLVLGIVLFSGSLYALALTGIRLLGAVTPLGGLAFLAGWLLVVLAFRGTSRA